ncbi:cytochrome P450 6a2-like [Battus philenor]|uniref:cytochrome P450 6a2-like n=1 Tax=Battus philenor TaxID=42288 RepID=UPI0035CF8ADD
MLLTVVALLALLALYRAATRSHSYWAARRVPHARPLPLVGNNLPNFLMRKSITEVLVDVYRAYPGEKVVGFYRALRPELIVRDPEIAKRILTTDFAHFYPRGLNSHKKVVEPMFRGLFFADGDLWRLLRQRMTPAFTSSKLRAMFPLVVARAAALGARVRAAAADGVEMDARELMARFTTDFIGACGFGLEADSLNDENSAFRKLGKKIFTISNRHFVMGILKHIFPELLKNVKLLEDVERDVIALVREILRQRDYRPSGRNDFIDLLLECRAKGLMVGESIERRKADGTPELAELELDDVLMAAQVFIFFAAGFETSSSATSFTLHQLAHHPHVQEKVQEEVDRVLAKYDNELSYDAVKEMTYLECAFKEGMRLFPSLGFLVRQCVGQYTFPELALTIDEGVQVFVPLQALHTDPLYFAQPLEFRPERFLPGGEASSGKYVYLPFGAGPRACIGERLGMMQSLAGLAAVLSRSSVRPAAGAPRQPRVDPRLGIVQGVQGGLPLRFVPRSRSSSS